MPVCRLIKPQLIRLRVSTLYKSVRPAWLDRLLEGLDGSDQRARSVAGVLTTEQLNWCPRPGSWSIGQCLEHLYIANRVYLPAISDALAGQPEEVASELRIGSPTRWFIRNYIAPNPTGARASAPKKIQPPTTVEERILQMLLESNLEVRELAKRASHTDVNRIRFKNPFIPLVRFTVGAGLEIIVQHQRRHLLQAERVRGLKEFPGDLI